MIPKQPSVKTLKKRPIVFGNDCNECSLDGCESLCHNVVMDRNNPDISCGFKESTLCGFSAVFRFKKGGFVENIISPTKYPKLASSGSGDDLFDNFLKSLKI